jgi:hypothetical protein
MAISHSKMSHIKMQPYSVRFATYCSDAFLQDRTQRPAHECIGHAFIILFCRGPELSPMTREVNCAIICVRKRHRDSYFTIIDAIGNSTIGLREGYLKTTTARLTCGVSWWCMKPLPAPNIPGKTEFERFDNAVRQVLSMSKDELLRRESREKRTRERKRRPKKS